MLFALTNLAIFYMKTIFKIILLCVFFNPNSPIKAQDIAGSWEGKLEVMGQSLPLLFHLQKNGEDWKGTMDSPKQGASDIPLSKVLFDGMLVNLEMAAGGIAFEGMFLNDRIQGTFKQGGMSLPLDLVRAGESVEEPKVHLRPQEPKPPFAYEIDEMAFQNKIENIQFKGTLTKPKGEGPFPAIILVSGSGPQNRDSELMGHKPFWVIADYLSTRGVVVLRYDERGVGESEGDFAIATSEDFKSDAGYAIQALSELDYVSDSRIGMLGHSEGGMIAWMLGAEAADLGLDYIIALAGPVIPIPQLMAKQTEDVSRASGSSRELAERQVSINSRFYKLIENSENLEEAKVQAQDLVDEIILEYDTNDSIKVQQKTALATTFQRSLNPWFYYFIRHRPEANIEAIEIPIFAAYGEKDMQVNAAQNANRLLKLFAQKEHLLTLKTYPNLNHLFQEANTGGISEYQEIEETFNEKVLGDILDFINTIKVDTQTKNP